LSLASIEGASRALNRETEGAKRKKCLAVKRGTHQSGGDTRDAFDHAQAALTQGAERLGRVTAPTPRVIGETRRW